MKRRRVSDIIIEIGTVIGILLVAYPMLSNYFYEKKQNELAEYYQNLAEQIPPEERRAMREKCIAYNKDLLEGNFRMSDPFADSQNGSRSELYESLLNIHDDGVMGTVEAPGLIAPLLIYHGTETEVLQKGAGHLYGTSLPVGGIGTHSVISAHTGISGKKLFTNLDQMEIGDVFYLSILGEKLAYLVDEINVVLPHETEYIKIDPDEDYCTLLTCTPYGINSHRLLVRGTRIPYEKALEIEKNQHKGITTWILMYLKSILAGLVVSVGTVLIIWFVRRGRNRKKKEGDVHEDEQKDV